MPVNFASKRCFKIYDLEITMKNVIQIGEMRSSSTARWLTCVGSAILCGGETSNSDQYANEGTQAHKLLEFSLAFDVEPSKVSSDREMVEAVGVAFEWVKKNVPNYRTERRFTGAPVGVPNWSGTMDVHGYDEGREILTIVDYKHGAGVAVKAFENLQLLSYAALVLFNGEFKFVKKIRIVVIQPRIGDEPIDVWETDFHRVLQHRTAVTQAARDIEWLRGKGNEPLVERRLVPGDYCQFCPALLKCPTVDKPLQRMLPTPLSDDYLAHETFVGSLTPAEVATWFGLKKRINKWLTLLSARAKELAEANELPGYKIVEALSNREWKDETSLDDLAGIGLDREKLIVATVKPLSPNQVESLELPDGVTRKELKELVATLTHRSVKGLTVVPESDKRSSKFIDVVNEFDDEEGDL